MRRAWHLFCEPIIALNTQADHVLKYWDFHDNKYLRASPGVGSIAGRPPPATGLFRSHTGKVTSVGSLLCKAGSLKISTFRLARIPMRCAAHDDHAETPCFACSPEDLFLSGAEELSAGV